MLHDTSNLEQNKLLLSEVKFPKMFQIIFQMTISNFLSKHISGHPKFSTKYEMMNM